ncbi:hypothetical protein KI809_09550 [Geobacter pelophilus]|uniref:Uncharacterized protein n=1 Tax=Geoanaerobacter pelophilus TaxID=60036 RepID=A0AAW4L4R2_9BACT|nr:hypothetical protein [Geoanaerobacter pelophilus]MBT0664542.1 hypothetical protein [Geoanaerobacter pelophilus]
MKALHLALTPLAGSPIRIVNALNRHTGISARLVVLNPVAYGTRVFENDLTWIPNDEDILALIETADILHFHHWMDLADNPFHFDFGRMVARGAKVVRHFHSTANFIANNNKEILDQIKDDPFPKIVIAQHQERYYPHARLVPNIVPLSAEEYTPLTRKPAEPSIFFAPSSPRSAWYSYDPLLRWDTKGAPEIMRLLDRVKSQFCAVTVRVRQNIPHDQCLRERRQSHISVDDIVTGGYHLSSLEGLSQGIPTFAWLDGRIQKVLHELTGADELPWLNFHLEDAEQAFSALLHDPDLRTSIGKLSRAWMEKYWSEPEMIQHYVSVYHDLYENPESFLEPRFNLNCKKTYWFVQQKDDLEWTTRAKRNMPFLKKISKRFSL